MAGELHGVTISAGYGAGGSIVAPAVAERLGLSVLDRAISSEVAAQLHVSVREAETGAMRRSLVDRFLGALTPLAGGVLGAGTDAAPAEAIGTADEATMFRDQAALIMRGALADGAVILGRAGAAVFRDEPAVLRVRLFGPSAARIRQGALIERVDEATAAQRINEVDRARAQYVRRLYNCDINDPDLFTVQLDSTALSLDACADLIVEAYLDFRR